MRDKKSLTICVLLAVLVSAVFTSAAQAMSNTEAWMLGTGDAYWFYHDHPWAGTPLGAASYYEGQFGRWVNLPVYSLQSYPQTCSYYLQVCCAPAFYPYDLYDY